MAHSRNRAQSSLEFLMTYAWAMVIIVSVFAVLFFVLSPPSPNVAFHSESRKFLLGGSEFSPGSPPSFKVKILNGTGRQIFLKGVSAGSGITITAPTEAEIGTSGITVQSGAFFEVRGEFDSSYPNRAGFEISYDSDYPNQKADFGVSGALPEGSFASPPPQAGCPADPSSCPDLMCREPSCDSASCSQTGAFVDFGQIDEACHDQTGCAAGTFDSCACDGAGACMVCVWRMCGFLPM
ncbi:MAG: hypothetical protein PHH08_03995 [Candidatus ainarchaeum sp.]|nr:hypothetical protein [Candidatus ainarchaeum sp.]